MFPLRRCALLKKKIKSFSNSVEIIYVENRRFFQNFDYTVIINARNIFMLIKVNVFNFKELFFFNCHRIFLCLPFSDS